LSTVAALPGEGTAGPKAVIARGPRLRPVVGVASFGVLLALTYFVYGRALDILPFSSDNLYILSWVDRSPASALLRVDPDVYPEWRPLAYLTVWFQYRWSGVDQPQAYFTVNLLLWAACGWLIYRIVVRVVGSAAAGLCAAAVIVSDPRAASALTWIVERQTSMACLFGLWALLVAIGSGEREIGPFGCIGICALLVASALSKEYGLAFAAAIAGCSLWERRLHVTAAAIAAMVLYAGVRIGFAGGAIATFCEDMGFFFSMRMVCYDGFNGRILAQTAYNIAALGVDVMFPGVLNGDGQISLARRLLATGVVWTGVAVYGWLKGPKEARVTALVLGANAALGFMLFRNRNHLVALCALGVSLGIGLAIVNSTLRARVPALMRWFAVSMLMCLVIAQAIHSRRVVSLAIESLLDEDTCDIRPMDVAFARRIRAAYQMNPSLCAADGRVEQ